MSSLVTRAVFRTLSLYRPARDYVMQMKYKPQPFYQQGLMTGEAGGSVRGRMFGQPLVELRDGTRVLLDTVLGKGFTVVELDDGKLPLAAPRADRTLDAKTVRVIPHDHRFLPRDGIDVTQVRDVSGTIGQVFDRAAIRGVILRPDRYVACCLARASGAVEADRSLDALVRLSNSPSQATVSSQSLDLAIA
jgi:3-(3-hydroxy-phenyl)propionate hydroxylase